MEQTDLNAKLYNTHKFERKKEKTYFILFTTVINNHHIQYGGSRTQMLVKRRKKQIDIVALMCLTLQHRSAHTHSHRRTHWHTLIAVSQLPAMMFTSQSNKQISTFTLSLSRSISLCALCESCIDRQYATTKHCWRCSYVAAFMENLFVRIALSVAHSHISPKKQKSHSCSFRMYFPSVAVSAESFLYLCSRLVVDPMRSYTLYGVAVVVDT